MAAVALALVALGQLGLLIVSVRTLRRHRSWDFAVPVAVTTALVYDNAILAFGGAIGEGDVLRVLSVPRYAGHAFFTPMLILFAFSCAARFGIARFSRREAATGWGFVVFVIIVIGVLEDLIHLELEAAHNGGLTSYSNVGTSGPPIPEITTVVCLLLIGGTIARYGRSPWMFASSIAMFIIASFWVSNAVIANTGELILLAGIIATALQSLGAEAERKERRKRAARSHDPAATVLLGPAGRLEDNERQERKRRSTRWNRYLGMMLLVAFPLSYLVGWWADRTTGTLDEWVDTADVLIQGLSTALLIGHAVYSFSVFGFPNPKRNLRTWNGYVSYLLLFTYLLSQAAFDVEPAHTILLAVSIGLIVVHVAIALTMRKDRPASGVTFAEDVRSVVAADAADVDRVRAETDPDRTSDIVIAARKVSVALAGVPVLTDVSLDVRRGEIVSLIGNNGAGKTTLLRTLCGLQAPSRGRVELGGVDVSRTSAAARARLGVTLVVGGHAVFGSLSVEENLRMFARRTRASDKHLDEALDRVYTEFGWIAERRSQPASTLSGGQHQMLAVAQGLLGTSELLVIDEFSLGLSPVVVDQLTTMVRTINASGTAVLLVEQSVPTALDLADRVFVLDHGEIVLTGTGDDLRAHPEHVTDLLLHTASSGV